MGFRVAVKVWLVTVVVVAASACAPTKESTQPTATGGTEPSSTGSNKPSPDPCADPSTKKPGQLTIATDSPAYEPWFVNDDPTNGKGFESAVAYATAKEMGFSRDQVEWTTVPFNSSYQPGQKSFDFDINQISSTAKRAEATRRHYLNAATKRAAAGVR